MRNNRMKAVKLKNNSEYKENFIESLRKELLDVVSDKLTPVAKTYGYSETKLEENIKWKPIVLVLGNYSSGKSTLINELLEHDVQNTGQAPTDDSFTVLTHGEGKVDERDGNVLLNDSIYPFSSLKKHGNRFSSHFRLKKIQSPILENLAIIDTPGMLDSVAEKDRGYNYQEVIGSLASMADLILVLFDPHKAGTVRETYNSLRNTLPRATFEDRLLFVLNRVDECTNLNDLLRVYGTLCWNLSQMTGRKDIPQIHLTYAPKIVNLDNGPQFLPLLENQRAQLKKSILRAPKHRLDNLTSYVENHGLKLTQLLETLKNYCNQKRKFLFKTWLTGIVISLVLGTASYWFLLGADFGDLISPLYTRFISGATILVFILFWFALTKLFFSKYFYKKAISDLDSLAQIEWENQKENWTVIKPIISKYLEGGDQKLHLRKIKQDLKSVKHNWEKTSKEARQALGEISNI